ncbi:replication initiation and membrane attachment family protein [Halobacillus karajensis]|uniref:Replication initiation and membrane attachment protein n=1 Tax=Halobacillus karajensis TaxID=195088 RepID=A0A024P7J3_9BACI|nr:DnaD domain protein [Halobacillus karajensis]CDQ18263.1 Replication initiation and membrane attachment protein [Halobacillus karajensis]CDQ24616.1 Replication initiation and membrane attachment protein [Halobacillus karajensis]CDQ29137.1 Replication initiation and membrane attachment protein [Halobacillus karajensis]
MNYSIGKLLPVDGFRIIRSGELPRSFHRSLSHLYQPIVGRLAVSLYHVLISEADMSGQDQIQSHHMLMAYLSAPLDKIYEAREKLEAIGLIRTFRSENEDHQAEYIYSVYPPFSPEEFFLDDMLSLLLSHELGNEKYERLKGRLLTTQQSLEGFTEVTATFDQVFHNKMIETVQKETEVLAKEKYQQESRGPITSLDRVDFEWLTHALKKRMYPADQILNGRNKKLIVQLATLYDLTNMELEKAVTWAIDENHYLVEEELKAACHDFMKEQKTNQPPQSGVDRREKVKTEKTQAAGSKEDQFIQMLEEISPRELLEDVSNGNRASEQDLKMIRDVMTEQGLEPGVMNVLVHYVLLKTDMKLSKAYLEKIASHWARKNVTTVRQAMNLAKAEHQKYQQWGKQKSQKRKGQKEEVIPAWFNNQEAPSHEKQKGTEVNTDDIAARIKKLTNKGN